MDYVQPVGEADPNAPYKDRNTGAGEPGSRVPAKAIENPQREIVNAIIAAGLDPDPARVDQLAEAIEQMIAQALGSGSNPLNDLLAILRARNPVYPTINNTGNVFSLSVPSTGVVRIPAGISITHRGCFNDVTAQQDFNTAANKTYHLRKRWFGSPGWALVDVMDSVYNPGGALAEANVAFDTTFDDMISHKVVTDASNVATITSLVNRDRLGTEVFQDLTPTAAIDNSWFAVHTATLNWSRCPSVIAVRSAIYLSMPDNAGFMHGGANYTSNEATNRYAHSHRVTSDWASTPSGIGAKVSRMWASFGA